MKKIFVFCIGGTGIRVMKSIIMMLASGMDTNGYAIVPVVLDPHLDLEEKKNLISLIDTYKTIYNHSVTNGTERLNALEGFFGSEVVKLEELNDKTNDAIQFTGSNQKFTSYINLSNLGNDDINNFFVRTLFSSKSLNSSLDVGFKGNPNVGTVVLGDMVQNANWYNAFKANCSDGDRIFIISSIFGGTGASGYPLLEKTIKEEKAMPAVKDALMGAVTVLPYYGLTDPAVSGSDIDSANFYTKTKAALAYYEKTVQSDYLYYAGEVKPSAVYENNEKEQKDSANFIELVAASALFDFAHRDKPDTTQYLTRAIESDQESMDLAAMGSGYKPIVKAVADFMLLRELVGILPKEKYFPLKKTHGLDEAFYNDSPFQALEKFTRSYHLWYQEISGTKRAFAPLSTEKVTSAWVKGLSLDAGDDSFYLLDMIKAGNADKQHTPKFRAFLQYAYQAINRYTNKI